MLEPKPCESCGVKFTPNHKNRKYCYSLKCAESRKKKLNKEYTS